MNGALDPITGQAELEAVLWKDGGPINLGTFGGTQSMAGSVNDHGQVVGCATNTIADAASVCMGVPQATQSRAFLWQDGTMRDLGTLGGTDANAFIVNQRGYRTTRVLVGRGSHDRSQYFSSSWGWLAATDRCVQHQRSWRDYWFGSAAWLQ
jgi:uncharacterized membrane protein